MIRVFAAALLGASLAASIVSCGGSSFDSDDGGDAGSGGTGSAGKGGSTSPGKGGASSAGTGASAGTTGTAGSGGTLPDLCSLPAETGACNAYFPSFFHNAATGVCEPFVYGGCGGNENRFDSVEACQAACSGGSPDLDSCTSSSECVLVSLQCCAPCDAGLESYTAVNAAQLEAFRESRECGLVGCEPCPAPDPLSSTRPYLAATCRNGACVPIDVRNEGASECEVQEDCHLRLGVGCCEGCSADTTGLVSVNGGDWLNLVCGDEPVGCPACAPIYPNDYAPICDEGSCSLIQVP